MNRRLAGLIFPLLLAAALAASARAQNSSPSDSTFTSNSELVVVPVQVTDPSGHPIQGLKKENFVLKSDGNPQRIALFEERSSNCASPPSGIAPPPAVATVSSSAPDTPTHFTNLRTEGIPNDLLIVAIDKVNTPAALQGWAREQLIRYWRVNPPQQPVEVVAVTFHGLRQMQSFTTDVNALTAAVRNMQTNLTRDDNHQVMLSRMDHNGRIDSYTSMVNEKLKNQADDIAGNVDGGAATLQNFEELAWAYSGIPGRKTVLWLTTGFPIQQEEPDGPSMIGRGNASSRLPYYGMHINNELLPAFQRAFTALNKSSVIVYPIDLQGLPLEEMWDVTQPSSLYIHPELSHLTPVRIPDTAAANRDGMKEMARRTGGKTCTAGNVMNSCFSQVVAESSDYYLLGFYVSQQHRKLGWHKLKVQVNPGYGEVRSRSTYFLRPLGTSPEQEQQEDMRSAIFAGVNYTGVIFTVEPGTRTSGSDAPVSFKVKVPASSILLLPGQEKLSFDVIAIPLSAQGTPVGTHSRMVKLDMNPQTAQKALAKGWNLINSVPGDPSTKAVKVIVRDNDTGRIGSITFPVSTKAAGS